MTVAIRDTQSKDNKQKAKDYLAAVLATAPVAAARTISGIPVKTSEGVLTSKFDEVINKKAKQPTISLYKKGIKRSLSSAAGAGAIGALTMPLYAKAMRDMSSDDPSDRKKGAALLLGQGVAFSTVKGLGEAVGESRRGAKFPQVAGKFKNKMAATAAIGLPAMVLTSKAIADSRRKARSNTKVKEESKKETFKGLLKPALISGAVSGAAGGVESLTEHIRSIPKGQRKAALQSMTAKKLGSIIGPRSLGYGLAGVGSGVLGSIIADKAIKRLKKSD